jgi:hypothetical protein
MRKVGWSAVGSGAVLAASGSTGMGTTIAGTLATAATGLLGVTVAPAVVGGAIALVGVSLIAPNAFRVVFPRKREKKHNKEIKNDDLSYKFWDCYHVKIYITGHRGTGKTTIREFLREQSKENIASTIVTTYHMLRLDEQSNTYGVLIDAAGVLVVVFDHFDTRDTGPPTETAFDDSRRQDHERFVEAVFSELDTAAAKESVHRPPNVVLLVTKKDLWQRGSDRWKVEDWMGAIRNRISSEFGHKVFGRLEMRPFDKDDEEDRRWLISTIVEMARARGM